MLIFSILRWHFFFSEKFPEDFGANRVTADVATPLIFVCKQLSLPHGRFAPLGLMLCGCACVNFKKSILLMGKFRLNQLRWLHPRNLTVRPWKTMIGRRCFPRNLVLFWVASCWTSRGATHGLARHLPKSQLVSQILSISSRNEMIISGRDLGDSGASACL